MRYTSKTPLLVHLDLLGSVANVRALDEVVYEGTSYEDERMLGEDKESGTCTKADRSVLGGCTCGEIGLVGGDSCSIIIKESISIRGARGKAGEERLEK